MHIEHLSDSCKKVGLALTPVWLYVSIKRQRLYFYKENVLAREFPASTSVKPPSCIANSLGTPLGLHRINSKIGGDAPLGMIFKARIPTGTCYHTMQESELGENLITTRILRLEGLEVGVNSGAGCDSFERYIYIHGTNREDKIGEPASHGCVLLKNDDIIRLFNECPEGSLVYISME